MYFVIKKNKRTAQWYWQLRAANHKIVASSGETYYNRVDAMKGIELVRKAVDAVVKGDGQENEEPESMQDLSAQAIANEAMRK